MTLISVLMTSHSKNIYAKLQPEFTTGIKRETALYNIRTVNSVATCCIYATFHTTLREKVQCA
jgi:hypothetical protein